ncbi:tRNA pseudouridine(38-40) synthase TruA [Stigmatella sp. ncwal1]|uniref:tRNA pseudouridine synthase n=1 Tax=Stigmatella ashevillensis TaxID=2995309 RepID=A0ABT5D2C8_9BACT|nr:tRNA pseudouridine(38-40) synthase TruA [Stigmatella ashevillena]MDC0707815.1 tRNA pseudouridine(38-40) synthase TruA [Stigmatella ashevillena]
MQSALEAVLRSTGVPATVMPAGRTDRGVHARMQVVSLRLEAGDEPEALAARLPALLPPDLGVCAVRKPHPSFHAQWSAAGKTYCYRVQLGGRGADAWRPYVMDAAEEPRLAQRAIAPERLAELLRMAVGSRDFWAFHASSSPRKSRTLESATVHELGGGLFEVRLRGDSFARYQVRYLVGSALLTAAGQLPEAQWRAALETAESIPGLRAAAAGLILWEVRYPPGVDPFSPADRTAPTGLPREPPFVDASGL